MNYLIASFNKFSRALNNHCWQRSKVLYRCTRERKRDCTFAVILPMIEGCCGICCATVNVSRETFAFAISRSVVVYFNIVDYANLDPKMLFTCHRHCFDLSLWFWTFIISDDIRTYK